MKILVGDELGTLKCYFPFKTGVNTQKSLVDSKFGIPQKHNEVISIRTLYNNNHVNQS